MNDEVDHLRHYAESGSEEAFAAVVQRYLPLVFHAALRRVGGDAHRAEDVTQLVFTALARNATVLARHPDLTGWLFTTTRFLATKAIRGERRRQSREHEVYSAQSEMTSDREHDRLPPLHAVLDDVMMDLRQLDRQVLLLRFHRGLRLAEIGAQLGVTENAVQKRIERALDQLKDKLARRGITSTAAALAVAFEQQSAIAVPTGLAAASTSAALASGAGIGGLLAISGLMMISKLQLGLAAVVVAAISTGLVWEVRENEQLRAEMAGQAAVASVGVSELQEQLAALTRRAAAAEADAAKLQQAMQAARTAQASAAPRGRALTDAQERANASMARAKQLINEGKLQEALEEYLKCYHDLAGAHGMPDQQIVMAGIKGLARNYSPAFTALRDLRDTAMQKLQARPGTRELITEIALLNERLDDGRASMALYDTLPPGDPGRQAVALIAHDSFVEAQRYADALVGKTFGAMMNELDMGIRAVPGKAGQSLVNRREYVIKGTLTNIETLIGAGQLDDARELTEKLYAFDGSEATRAAVKQHAERAGHPPTP
jgi:RNA polymerase sigma factor (sigma-70 family)